MVDLDDLRSRPDVYQKAANDKGINVDISEFLKVDMERKKIIPSVEDIRKKQNAASRELPGLDGQEREKLLSEMKDLSAELKQKEKKLADIEEEWMKYQLRLPSIPLEGVPVGKDSSDNRESSRWGEATKFDFEFKDHVAIGEALNIVDIPRGVKVAGTRSYFLKGAGAMLEQAVLKYALDFLVAKGWIAFSPPVMAKRECLMGTGFFPGSEEQTYSVDDNFLVGTSEVSVCSYHREEILDDLPKRYCGISPCFRREAGTYGKDTKGLYRVHQFMKVEQVVLCEAYKAAALKLYDEIRANAEELLQMLELPYRIVDVCTGDMGQGKVFMQDIETWMPGRNAYCETHSCSYLGDFQARRLNIRYDSGSGNRFVHTLNNTLIATPRILIPILEIYQNSDGSVNIPKVLQPYMGGMRKIE